MNLTLKIINESLGNDSQYMFSGYGGTIGRNDSCTWHLVGPFVSRIHAEIEYREGRYYLIDKSTNGVALAGSHTPIQKGEPYRIRNNDTFKIDSFEIAAIIEETNHNSADDPFAVFHPSAPYIEPNVDRLANINDPVTFPDQRQTEHQIFEPSSKGSNIQDKPFQATEGYPDPSDLNFQITPPSKAEADLDIFSVGGHIPRDSNISNSPLTAKEKPANPVSVSDKAPENSTIEEENNNITGQYEKILEGAGISNITSTSSNTDDFYLLIGKILHECTQGLIDLLSSRSEIKGQLRLDRTMIGQQRENNPLKFMPNAEEVIVQTLLNERNASYLPILQAIQEAFDDLKSHQFAMSMSVQDALKTTIKSHFSPDKIKQKLDKDNSIFNKIPMQRDANLWGMFEDMYTDIEQEASEAFEVLLEKEIAKAYKLHSMELKYHRKVQKKQQ